MKLVFRGHDERYVVEQSLMNLFPGELPVYEPITPGDDSWAVISLEETGDLCRVAVSLCRGGKTTEQTYQEPLSGGDFQREGLRRHAVGACFFLAARAVTGVTPPWGMLTGVRPDKPVTWALEDGKSPEEARAYLEEHYFVTPSRAALALETGATAAKAARWLEKRDIDVYVGIPFCPTRCAYCSFVSQSVERSFALVPPYVDALCGEISAGGEMVRRAGLRVRTFYMGGGTPTTLTAEQMDRVLTAFETSFDLQCRGGLAGAGGAGQQDDAGLLPVIGNLLGRRLHFFGKGGVARLRKALGVRADSVVDLFQGIGHGDAPFTVLHKRRRRRSGWPATSPAAGYTRWDISR